ncbi:alpha/beta hydrolase [Aquicoccus porphyridii]|uniref:Alpha/beta hydrolase n=1 Tax=Aquicoccus porphyridii TaxID=1852029 RepID=A0A5A9ZCE6_9RHOB|nr:alpha/beta hydrolase [Aquicoccus porphyridii]KAA0914907.1 alpha/beta hydrolase [Aquicoccus porphyridii]RAI52549.1 alpha/beta hydrolase [Rhodobacteraceae bacterium AsT-22]
MTMHPDLTRMMESNRATGGPALQDMAIKDARAAMRDMFLANGYPIRHEAHVTHHTPAETGAKFAASLYRPLHSEGALPALVYFHGGGFVLGDAATYDIHSRALAHLLGVTVVFIEYRLAPESPFPAAVEDACAAMDWLGREAPALEIDPARIAVMGESAGGNLAVNAVIHARKSAALDIRGATLIYPVTDARPFADDSRVAAYPSISAYATGTNLDHAEMQWFFDTYLTDPADAARPENALFEHPELALMPTTRIFTAECDPLRDMGMSFAPRLIEAGVSARAECLPGMLHSFMCHGGISGQALRHFFRIVEAISEDFDS